MRSASRCPTFYGEIPPMRWGILNDDGGYFYCITYTPTAVAAPLSEMSIICVIRSCMRIWSPGCIRVHSTSAASGLTSTILPRRPLSMASKQVIIFVMLAGYSRLSAFFSYSTRPDPVSTTMAASAVISGGTAANARAETAKSINSKTIIGGS